MALAYTSVARVYDLEPLIGSLTELTSSQIVTAFAEPAEALIHAKISRNYTVPVTGTIPLLQALADDITVYRILSRRVYTGEQLKDSAWPDRFKEALDTLDELAKGQLLLVNSAGTIIGTRTDLAQVKTNVSGYESTFHEGGDWEDQVKDPDKEDDLLNDRGL